MARFEAAERLARCWPMSVLNGSQILALVMVALTLAGCGGPKLSASATAHELKSDTAYREVSCAPSHRRYWDYECRMTPGTGPGQGPDLIGVRVDARQIVAQEAP
jgi:hypothetical protein